MLSNRHTHTQTDTQTKYCNPRCACAPRVNNRLGIAFILIGHCSHYLIRMTTSAGSGFIVQVGSSVVKGIPNTFIIHQTITIPSSFKELAQTLVCQRTHISIHLLAIEAWWIVRGLMDDKCVLDFLNE